MFRDVADFLPSGFAQRVCGPQKYTGTARQHHNELEAWGHLAYDERIKAFQNVFGKENVHVRSYDNIKRDIVAPLFDLAELPPRQTLTEPQRLNPTRSWFYVATTRHINKIPASLTPVPSFARRIRDLADLILRHILSEKTMARLFSPYSTQDIHEFTEKYGSTHTLLRRFTGQKRCDSSVDDPS